MSRETAHEPNARVMCAAAVVEDARRLEALLRSGVPQGAHAGVQISLPFSSLLGALDGMTRDEMITLRQKLDERLAG